MKNIARTIVIFIVLSAIALFILKPMLGPGMLVTDDGDWFVIRLSAFYQTWSDGQFPVRFLSRLNFNYGYPSPNFAYPGYLYIGSLLHLVGIPFSSVIEILTIGSIIITAWCIYLWLSSFFPIIPAFIGSLSYLLSPYLAYDVFKRGSIGEIMAGMFGALTLVSIERNWRWLVAPAVMFVILSHNTIGMIIFGLIFLYSLVCKEKKRWVMYSVFMGVGLAAFFWMPALYEQRFVVFSKISVSDPRVYLGESSRLLIASLGIVVSMIGAFFLRRASGERVKTLVSLSIGALTAITFLLSPFSSGIWGIDFFGRIIQFPYRLLALTWLIGPFVVAAFVSYVSSIRGLLIGLCIVGSMIPFVYSLSTRSQSIYREEGYYTTNESTTSTHDEYMPIWVKVRPSAHSYERIVFVEGAGKILPQTVDTQHIDVIIDAHGDSIVQINTVFYPGWGGMLDGVPLKIAFDNPMGLMQIKVPQGQHRLVMAFRETPFRFITLLISLGTLIMWGILDLIDGGVLGRMIGIHRVPQSDGSRPLDEKTRSVRKKKGSHGKS